MPTTAQEVYNQVVCHLSSGERLRLATIILNQLVGQQQPSLDQSDTWTEEDQIDLVNFSLNYAAKTFSDVEGGWLVTFSTGDVVTVDFPGVTGIKRRPAVVLSSDDGKP